MNAVASLSPLLALRELQERAERELAASPNTAAEARVQLLGHIVKYMETVTRAAFDGASPEDVRERALRLGRESHRVWANLLLAASGLLESLNVTIDNFFEKALQAWPLLAQHAEQFLPRLPARARVYLRAVGYIIMGAPIPSPPPDVTIDSLALVVAQAQDEPGLLFLGLQQALMFFGAVSDASLPPAILEAIGRELWNCVRGGAETEDFEDAYLSARADEAKLESGDWTSLDELTGRTH